MGKERGKLTTVYEAVQMDLEPKEASIVKVEFGEIGDTF